MCILHIKFILKHKAYLALVDYSYIICIEWYNNIYKYGNYDVL